MKSRGFSIIDATLWGMVVYLSLHVPYIEMRVEEYIENPAPREQPPASTAKPELSNEHLNMGKCFHMPRSMCPPEADCAKVGSMAVFCCDLNSTRLKDALAATMSQNTTYLHVLNATIDELDVSQAMFRRLASMAFTDGNIKKIVGQFPKHSSIACLNISNNNLASSKLQPPNQRPFEYLFNLSVLDASANNLTEFPLSRINRNISVDLSGNSYIPCKHFRKTMDTNNGSLLTLLNYEDTYCALEIDFNWFKVVRIVSIKFLKREEEVNASCRNIKPENINCTCRSERLEFEGSELITAVAVDCSHQHLTAMPTNLPPYTIKLNVSYNNITSLQNINDPTYDYLRQLIVDHNDISSIVEVEGTKFIDNYILFSIEYNKLETIHMYELLYSFDLRGAKLCIAGNVVHCDCNTEKTLKPLLLENFKNLPNYKMVKCENGVPVVELVEANVCHGPSTLYV